MRRTLLLILIAISTAAPAQQQDYAAAYDAWDAGNYAVALERHEVFAVHLGPAAAEAHHERDGRTVDVAIHQAHAARAAALLEQLGEGTGEVHREGGLAHAALAGGDRH